MAQQPELLFFNKSDPDYKKACSAYLRLTQYLTFDDLHSLHTNTNAKCLYYQRTPDIKGQNAKRKLKIIIKKLNSKYDKMRSKNGGVD